MELQTASPLDERRALARTAFDELGQVIGGGATLHRAIADRVFGGVERGTYAESRARRLGFRAEHGAHVGGATHFALLNHPAVYARLRGWLATPPEALAGPTEPA